MCKKKEWCCAMNELIRVDYTNDQPAVSARELHEFLEVGARYNDWFPRMCEYGFSEGQDFNLLKIERVQQEGTRMVNRMVDDAILSIDMAKEICMLQRNEKGKIDGREYDDYQATQMQRRIERQIRKEKRLQTAYKAAGLEKDAQNSKIRLRQLNKKYREFSKAAGLPEQRERMKVLYVDDASKAKAANDLKMRRNLV